MSDQQRKNAMIRSIQDLQLSNALILALDHAKTAASVENAVNELMRYAEHWN
ncbi:hypothetical protein [Acinetobacter sp. TGL-Y2]|uniref:hypothetical protein n=1 Tax=Acinetobacter sp. TGL-Y2 TaxID=1407071 RepID=UPI000AF143EF|nr:hypothetical protein [Acinetobacter sp. TGL-Y2]